MPSYKCVTADESVKRVEGHASVRRAGNWRGGRQGQECSRGKAGRTANL